MVHGGPKAPHPALAHGRPNRVKGIWHVRARGRGFGDGGLIGDFGLAAGGAGGVELDRYDLAPGTPQHAMLLASNWGHSDNYPPVSEEITHAFPGRGGTQDSQMRGDMIYFARRRETAPFFQRDRLHGVGRCPVMAGKAAWRQSCATSLARLQETASLQGINSRAMKNCGVKSDAFTSRAGTMPKRKTPGNLPLRHWPRTAFVREPGKGGLASGISARAA